MATFKSLIDGVQAYQTQFSVNTTEGTLDKNEDFLKSLEYTEDLTTANILSFFDRKALNDEYKESYKTGESSYSHVQLEINHIYSFHKSFALRFKSRLGYYRDALSQKQVHARLSTNYAMATFAKEKEKAEQRIV